MQLLAIMECCSTVEARITYLQDHLEEMNSTASNVIFLIMWPVFNVMLVPFVHLCSTQVKSLAKFLVFSI